LYSFLDVFLSRRDAPGSGQAAAEEEARRSGFFVPPAGTKQVHPLPHVLNAFPHTQTKLSHRWSTADRRTTLTHDTPSTPTSSQEEAEEPQKRERQPAEEELLGVYVAFLLFSRLFTCAFAS
jgi:hypothetical protein